MSRLALAVVIAVLNISVGRLHAATINGYGAMGASETYGTAISGSWVPWLVSERGLNFGPSQSYNRAVNNANSRTLIAQGQHHQVGNLVSQDRVDVGILFIGGLDIGNEGIGVLTGFQTSEVLAIEIRDRIMTAVDRVLSADPVGMIVMGIPEMSMTPFFRSLDLPTETTDLLNELVATTNDRLRTATLARGQVFVDTAAAMHSIDGGALVVGGVVMDLVNPGTGVQNFFSDHIHPYTVGNGFIANLILEAINVGFETEYDLISDRRILERANALHLYQGETSNIDYRHFIYTAVPEPASISLAAAGGVGLLVGWRGARRRKRAGTPAT